MRKPKVTVTPFRLVLWTLCLALILVLMFQDSLRRGDDSAPRPAPADEATADRAEPRLDTHLVIAALPRAAHLVVLNGLHMNLYAMAPIDFPKAVAGHVYRSTAELTEALEDGRVALAALPVRDAVRMLLEDPEGAPRIVAGVAAGDERPVVRGTAPPDFGVPRLRVALADPPTLDLAVLLRAADGDGAVIELVEPPSAARAALLADEVDVALLPEPFAASIAPFSGATVMAAPAALAGGAVLVVQRELVDDPSFAPTLLRLLEAHLVTAGALRQDPDTFVDRACALLKELGHEVPDRLFWREALPHVQPGADLPERALENALAAARSLGLAPQDRTVDDLVRRDLLAAARQSLSGD